MLPRGARLQVQVQITYPNEEGRKSRPFVGVEASEGKLAPYTASASASTSTSTSTFGVSHDVITYLITGLPLPNKG